MNYTSNKGHRLKGNVPFSWEKKPGERRTLIIKDGHKDEEEENILHRSGDHIAIELPPPPYKSSKASFHDLKIPLPPGVFVIPPPKRSSSLRGTQKEDDPFLTAYKECTKSSGQKGIGSLRKSMSCKDSCSVKDDSIVRISHLPFSKSQR